MTTACRVVSVNPATVASIVSAGRIFNHALVRPVRYGEVVRFATMPSAPWLLAQWLCSVLVVFRSGGDGVGRVSR